MKHYFAYGTLLDVPSMQAFAPSSVPEGIFRLDGYELGFAETTLPGKGGCWLVPRDGAVTFGLHYRLSDDDMARMDEASGVPQGLWVHKPIRIAGPAGEVVETMTYTIPGDPPPFAPSEDYVRPILKGLSALELPADYVRRVEAIVAAARGEAAGDAPR